ncbi:hypothetical protein GBA52_002430 [Prunus armeniaca]|nr:hypothetical protein GBA52_002430 [Prunus armeniaca]
MKNIYIKNQLQNQFPNLPQQHQPNPSCFPIPNSSPSPTTPLFPSFSFSLLADKAYLFKKDRVELDPRRRNSLASAPLAASSMRVSPSQWPQVLQSSSSYPIFQPQHQHHRHKLTHLYHPKSHFSL